MVVQVDEPDEKFFVASFLKGLRTGTFDVAIFIETKATMDEICTREKKHIDAEEATASKKVRYNRDDCERNQKSAKEENATTRERVSHWGGAVPKSDTQYGNPNTSSR